MSTHTVSEVVARPVRTAGQGSLGWIVTELIDAFFVDLSEQQYGVLVLALTVVFGFIHVAVENGLRKAILRTIPPLEAEVVSDVPEVQP